MPVLQVKERWQTSAEGGKLITVCMAVVHLCACVGHKGNHPVLSETSLPFLQHHSVTTQIVHAGSYVAIHSVVLMYLQDLLRSWPVVRILPPAGLYEVLDVCRNLRRNRWALIFLDLRVCVIWVFHVREGNLMHKDLKQDHPVGEHITALVDPFLAVEFWCHPA